MLDGCALRMSTGDSRTVEKDSLSRFRNKEVLQIWDHLEVLLWIDRVSQMLSMFII